MDTDDLTPMAYETITRAGQVLDVLRSEIGASARGKKDEDEFLRGVAIHLRAILRSARWYLDGWNYLDTVNVREFRKRVKELLDHVEGTLATPLAARSRRGCGWDRAVIIY
jgi:hypothetical protein